MVLREPTLEIFFLLSPLSLSLSLSLSLTITLSIDTHSLSLFLNLPPFSLSFSLSSISLPYMIKTVTILFTLSHCQFLSLSQTLSLGSGFNDHDTFVPSAEEADYSQNVKRRNKKAD